MELLSAELSGLSLDPLMEQHFLGNTEQINRMIACADLCASDVVVEVGAGIGTVARHFPAVKWLTLVELDVALAGILQSLVDEQHFFRTSPNQILVLQRDALLVLRDIECDVVFSNLPCFLTPCVLRVLQDKKFRTTIMCVHEDDPTINPSIASAEGALAPLHGYPPLMVQELMMLQRDDFFPPQPFRSRVVAITGARPC